MFSAGFADPVHDSQRVFRSILNALSRPGQIEALEAANIAIPPLSGTLFSIVLALTDHDTPLWLTEGYHLDEVRALIGFHTGAPIVDKPHRAQFAFAPSAELPRLDQFNLGTQDYPDRSTTVVVAVPSLEGGPELVLRGPGIEDHWHIAPQGLPNDFVSQWAANRELFPRGIDLLLVADGKVVGLPRTVRIEEGH